MSQHPSCKYRRSGLLDVIMCVIVSIASFSDPVLKTFNVKMRACKNIFITFFDFCYQAERGNKICTDQWSGLKIDVNKDMSQIQFFSHIVTLQVTLSLRHSSEWNKWIFFQSQNTPYILVLGVLKGRELLPRGAVFNIFLQETEQKLTLTSGSINLRFEKM